MFENELALSSSKTKCIVFGRGEPTVCLKIHRPNCLHVDSCSCDIVSSRRSHKFLGLMIDADLRFKSHIEKLRGKVRAGIAILARIRRSCSLNLRKAVYHALVGSHLQYMFTDHCRSPLSKKLRCSNVERFALQWVSLPERRKIPHTGDLESFRSENCMQGGSCCSTFCK